MTRVVVPYAKITNGCEESLRRHAPHAERVYVGDDPCDYWRLLCRVWADGEDFILIEHDMAFDGIALEVLEACSEPVCASALFFQIIRFRSEIMQARPQLFEDIPPTERHWLALEYCLRRHGLLERHRHRVNPAPFNDSGRRCIDHPAERWRVWAEWLRRLPAEHRDDWTDRAWAAVHCNPDGTDDGRACSFPGCRRAGRALVFPTTCYRCRIDPAD